MKLPAIINLKCLLVSLLLLLRFFFLLLQDFGQASRLLELFHEPSVLNRTVSKSNHILRLRQSKRNVMGNKNSSSSATKLPCQSFFVEMAADMCIHCTEDVVQDQNSSSRI